MTALPWEGPSFEEVGREVLPEDRIRMSHDPYEHSHSPWTLRCMRCGAQSDRAGSYDHPCGARRDK